MPRIPPLTRPRQTPLGRVQQSQRDKQRMRARAQGQPEPPVLPPGEPSFDWLGQTIQVRTPWGSDAMDVSAYVTHMTMNTSLSSNTPQWSIDWAAQDGATSGAYVYDATNWLEPVSARFNYERPYYESLTATGGLVAPLTPIYEMATPWQAVEPISQEEADRRLAATREVAHRNAIRRKRAVKKGRRLLLEVLDDAQRRQYARHKAFTVAGADGKRYILRKGGTTHELDQDGRAILSHCIHLPFSYIDEDTLVAVKLLLETDPATFRQIANTSQIAFPSIPQVMLERAEALAAGFAAVNERFRALGEAAERTRRSVDRLGRAINYAGYARELEGQVAAEETGGIALPLSARQYRTAQALGHAETIAGDQVALAA